MKKTVYRILMLSAALSISLFGAVAETEMMRFSYYQANEISGTLQFDLGSYEVEETNGYARILAENADLTYDEGLPELPQFSTMYEINPYKNYEVSFEVIESHVIENIVVYPRAYHSQNENAQEFDRREDFYQSDVFVPQNNVKSSSRQNMRGLEILNVTVIPFTYHPAEQLLEVFDQINIFITETGDRDNADYVPRPRSRTFETLYEDLVINYDAQNREDEYQTPAILYICGGNSESHPYTQNLFDWRHKRGYIVYSATTSETGSSNSQIKNYISSAYNNFNPPPEFVCLIGDVGGTYNIPTYTEYWSGYNGEGDHPYSQLDGGDLLPEVLLGRISVNSTTQLSNVINKTIKYEQATYMGNNWFEKAALVGDPSSSGLSVIITNENIANILDVYGVEDIRTNFSGGYSNWMQSQLDEGILYFNYRGYYGVSGFGSSNINGASNGYMTPFASFITCGTGSFASGTALSESFIQIGTTGSPKGAVAAVGTATLGTHTGINNIVDMGFYDGIFSKSIETAGGALAAGKLALYHTYPDDPHDKVSIFTHWNNLMGDPALHLWTDTPEYFTADYPAVIGLGTNFVEFVVTDNSGMPVQDALVTLTTGNDAIFTTILTNVDGIATIPLQVGYTGSVDFCITKRNFKPLYDDFTISAAGPSVNLYSSTVIINDDAGNNDGNLNPDETVEITIPLTNFGSQDALDVTAVLTAGSDLVTIVESTYFYDSVPVGGVQYGVFEISLDPSAIQFEELDLRLNITDGSLNTWDTLVPLTVYAPKLEISFLEFDGNDMLYPAGSAQITMQLKNLGLVDAENVTASISSDNDLLTFGETLLTWSAVNSGNTALSENSVEITIDGDVINGTLLTLNVHIESADGYDQIEYYQFNAGLTGESDPLGPDSYGYYIYDSGDISYNLSPVYNWMEIDPDFGGPGTSLNMNDNGNGSPQSQQSAHLDLPFTFTFYGVDYSEITVSTNGWIAFGDSELESFRNYPLPGAGGPSPMVAAFWDDLETSNGGQVYKYVNSTDEYVVIEWSEMRTFDQNDVETFQIILYNAYTPSGDDEILIQYKEFNNTTVGNMQSGGIYHGSYSTIGIENHFGNDGLQYTYDDDYPVPAMELYDETALFITTRMPEVLPSPAMVYTPGSFEFTMGPDQSFSQDLTISNTGEEGSLLYYSLSQSGFYMPAPTEDIFGHGWTDTDLDDTLPFEWIDISGMGTQLTFPHNDQAGDPIDLPFVFPFYGEEYTQCIVNANGWIGFGDDNNAWQNMGLPSSEGPRPAIFPFFDDLNPVNDGNSNNMGGYVYFYGTADYVVFWFDHVEHWDGEINGNYDFQAVLYPSGEIHFNYNEFEGTINRCTIGIQNANGNDAIEIVHDEDYVHEQLSIVIKKNAEWLLLDSPTGEMDGELMDGEYVDISITADALDLSLGEYVAYVFVNSNAQPRLTLPVLLTVSDDVEILMGDVNYDQVLNVLDIVTLVSFIIGDLIPTPEQFFLADLTEDDVLNVLDIVVLVNLVLDT